MITCYPRYTLDPYKVEYFYHYARLWILIVNRFGGQHHGFLALEGVSNIGVTLFSFASLNAYEEYRRASVEDAECKAAYESAEQARCIVSYERTFMRPVLG